MKCSEDYFDFKGYLEWQEDRSIRDGFGSENNQFIREFVKTQTFHEFIEQNYEKEEVESAAVFFESCIEYLNKSSLKKLKSA